MAWKCTTIHCICTASRMHYTNQSWSLILIEITSCLNPIEIPRAFNAPNLYVAMIQLTVQSSAPYQTKLMSLASKVLNGKL